MSSIWEHFEKVPNSSFARCIMCRKEYSYKTTITNLKKHLSCKHKSAYNYYLSGRSDDARALKSARKSEDQQLLVVEQANEDSEYQELSEEQSDGNESTYTMYEIEELSQDETEKKEKKHIRHRENKSTQDFRFIRGRKSSLKEELPTETRAPQQLNAAPEIKDDEYEMFGRLIASKLRKMKNPNTRDYLMNDVHNIVFRTCVEDRVVESEPANANRTINHPTTTSQSQNPQVSQQNVVKHKHHIIIGDPLSMPSTD